MGTEPDGDRSPVRVLDRIRTNPTGRLALKIAIALLGGLVIALGIILIPFPGPGWAIVIFGLAIWSIEFTWAKSVLKYTWGSVRLSFGVDLIAEGREWLASQ